MSWRVEGRRWSGAWALLLTLLVIPGSSRAVSQAGAIVDTFSPSARGAALGDAGGLIPEGPFAMRWNPAGVALDQPVSVGFTHNELVPDFADDIWIMHAGGTAEYGPFGLGLYYARLDLGKQLSSGTGNENGETFESSETALRFGGAIELFDLFDADTGDYEIDLSVGLGAKWLNVELVPPEVTQDLGLPAGAGEASSWTWDSGAFLRFGRHVDFGSPERSYLGMRASLAYDCLRGDDLEFADQNDPLPRRVRYGLAFEADLFPHPVVGDLVGVIFAFERLDSRVEGVDERIDGFGLEVAVANTLVLRGGSQDDVTGDIVAGTYGVGLRLGPRDRKWVVELDYASRPQASGLSRVDMFTAIVGFDLFR